MIVLASSLNISSAEVLSVFNLQFFDLSITDLPSENIDIDVDDDGIVNAEDDCPYVPEDYDGFEDHDGCPETDMTMTASLTFRIAARTSLYCETGWDGSFVKA